MNSVFNAYSALHIEPMETWGVQMQYYHIHDKYELSLFTSGTVTITGGTSRVTVTAPFIRVHRPYTIHHTTGTPDNNYCIRTNLYFSESSFQGIDHTYIDLPHMFPQDLTVIPLTAEQHTHMQKLLNMLMDPENREILPLLAAGFIGEADRLNEDKLLPTYTMEYRYICDIIRYICDNYHSPVSAAELAAAHFVSVAKLNRDFRRYTQTTLHDFLIRYRLRGALHLLEEDSVADTAHKCGFNDVSHFIRTFRKTYGITPLQYRKSLRKDTQT
ncbi:MAG: helix-turn-helix transcriptional regulator [Clostridia bacterium]|nr:helix-turn-helix transcriptional regulator [Clostridia bacterium]